MLDGNFMVFPFHKYYSIFMKLGMEGFYFGTASSFLSTYFRNKEHQVASQYNTLICSKSAKILWLNGCELSKIYTDFNRLDPVRVLKSSPNQFR